jgi:hypothetical protein
METIHQIYEKAPALISIPPELRDRPVEVLIRPLVIADLPQPSHEVDENGWPLGFFAETYGSLPDRALK